MTSADTTGTAAPTDLSRPTDHVLDLQVSRLATAVADGRLDLDEFDRRTRAVYAATTLDQALAATADLTPAGSRDVRTFGHHRSADPTPRARPGLPLHQRIEWATWAAASLVNLLVWIAVSVGVGSSVYSWPIWVAGPWGLVLAARTLSGVERPRARRRAAA